MMKRIKITALLLTLMMIIQLVPLYSSGASVSIESVEEESVSSSAIHTAGATEQSLIPPDTEIIDEGLLGDNLTWTFYYGGILYITGSGGMIDGAYYDAWYDYKDEIKSVVIDDGVRTISAHAFEDCPKLTSVTLPESMNTIYDAAFSGCAKLTSIIFPSSVVNIEDYAFYDCLELESVIFSEGVQSIGISTFYGCSKLTTVDIPSSIKNIGDDAFFNCSALTQINVATSNSKYRSLGGVLFNKEETTLIKCPEGNARMEYVIPSTVETVYYGAFGNCSKLVKITIPSSVTTINPYAFEFCPGLKDIKVNENNNNYKDIDGVLFDKQGTTLIRCPEGNERTEYIFPEDVTTIDVGAFDSCIKFTSIDIPERITSIGAGAFFNCSELTKTYFYGDAPSVGLNAFLYTADNFTIYFLAEKKGGDNPWTTPSWSSGEDIYNTAIFDPDKFAYDMNGDTAINLLDLLVLMSNVNSGSTDTKYDLNSDGNINNDDAKLLMREILVQS